MNESEPEVKVKDINCWLAGISSPMAYLTEALPLGRVA